MDQVTTEELRIMKHRTPSATLRETLYRAEYVKGEIRYLFTEIRSDGTRAYKVVIRRGTTQEYSHAMVYTGLLGGHSFVWEETGVVRDPLEWFFSTVARSQYCVPSSVATLAYALFTMATDAQGK